MHLCSERADCQLTQFPQANGQPYIIYGKPAYGISHNILAPFRGSQLTPPQLDINKSMSRVRISVGWTFEKICQYSTYLDFKRNNKVLLRPIGKYYTTAALLTNCHTCLYGSLTSSFFEVNPPSLKTYQMFEVLVSILHQIYIITEYLLWKIIHY